MTEHKIKLTNNEIVLLLDCLEAFMGDKHYKADPKRADDIYELYQTIGQALGETNITLNFTETDSND